MFDRVSYKKSAKELLKGNWKQPLLVMLVCLGVSLLISSIGVQNKSLERAATLLETLLRGILSISISFFFISFAKDRENTSFNTFVNGATSLWLKGLLAHLWILLWVFLWALLLIVPGIIKAISYSQTYFLLAENPKIGVRKAMKLSMKITKGHLADIFIMALSFTGWLLLSVFTLFIGLFWLIPYMSLSFTKAYLAMKDEALQSGAITEADLSDTPSESPSAAEPAAQN